jgi:hypothetical protein
MFSKTKELLSLLLLTTCEKQGEHLNIEPMEHLVLVACVARDNMICPTISANSDF